MSGDLSYSQRLDQAALSVVSLLLDHDVDGDIGFLISRHIDFHRITEILKQQWNLMQNLLPSVHLHLILQSGLNFQGDEGFVLLDGKLTSHGQRRIVNIWCTNKPANLGLKCGFISFLIDTGYQAEVCWRDPFQTELRKTDNSVKALRTKRSQVGCRKVCLLKDQTRTIQQRPVWLRMYQPDVTTISGQDDPLWKDVDLPFVLLSCVAAEVKFSDVMKEPNGLENTEHVKDCMQSLLDLKLIKQTGGSQTATSSSSTLKLEVPYEITRAGKFFCQSSLHPRLASAVWAELQENPTEHLIYLACALQVTGFQVKLSAMYKKIEADRRKTHSRTEKYMFMETKCGEVGGLLETLPQSEHSLSPDSVAELVWDLYAIENSPSHQLRHSLRVKLAAQALSRATQLGSHLVELIATLEPTIQPRRAYTHEEITTIVQSFLCRYFPESLAVKVSDTQLKFDDNSSIKLPASALSRVSDGQRVWVGHQTNDGCEVSLESIQVISLPEYQRPTTEQQPSHAH